MGSSELLAAIASQMSSTKSSFSDNSSLFDFTSYLFRSHVGASFDVSHVRADAGRSDTAHFSARRNGGEPPSAFRPTALPGYRRNLDFAASPSRLRAPCGPRSSLEKGKTPFLSKASVTLSTPPTISICRIYGMPIRARKLENRCERSSLYSSDIRQTQLRLFNFFK